MDDKQMLEAAELAIKSCADYCKARGITSGLTGKQHAGMIVHSLMDAGIVDEANKLEAFAIVAALENGSALRQKLEKEKVLGQAATVAQSYI